MINSMRNSQLRAIPLKDALAQCSPTTRRRNEEREMSSGAVFSGLHWKPIDVKRSLINFLHIGQLTLLGELRVPISIADRGVTKADRSWSESGRR